MNYLTEDFFKAVGASKTLTYLNLDSNTYCPKYPHLAKAIAMNKRNNGVLKAISMVAWMNSYAQANAFFNAMKVSDQEHEYWYGDTKLAGQMKLEQLEKKFSCCLEYLNFRDCNWSGNGYNHKNMLK